MSKYWQTFVTFSIFENYHLKWISLIIQIKKSQVTFIKCSIVFSTNRAIENLMFRPNKLLRRSLKMDKELNMRGNYHKYKSYFYVELLLVSTYIVCERLSVMHEPAGVVEILVQIP